MNARRRIFSALVLAFGVTAAGGCYGTGTAYVGVYGPPMYGPSPWGGYPYPGRYPPVGGTIWIGAPRCCEEEQDEEQAPQIDGSTESTSETDEAEAGSAEQASHPPVGALEPIG